MWIRNAWYVAAWASEVVAGKLLGRTFLDTPFILYRTGEGDIVALEDRCCHRHAPLSRGRLEGDDVRCMYHGIKFDSTGRCIEIPGEETVPPQAWVAASIVVEKQNLIWIWLGDPALSDPDDIIDLPYLDSPDWAYREGYLHYNSDYRLIADNLLDFSHLPYVHEKTIGSSGLGQERPTSEPRDYGIRFVNFNRDDDPAPHIKIFGGFEGKIDRWSINDWYYKGNLLVMDAGTIAAGSDGPDGDRTGAVEFRHLSALTPETKATCHYHFAQTQGFAPEDDKISDTLFDTVVAAFNEDKDMIEAQQQVINLDSDRPMMAMPFDGPLMHIRRKVELAIKKEMVA